MVPLTTFLDLLNDLLTVVTALAVSGLAFATLLLGRQLLVLPSVRATFRQAASLTLRGDPNVHFERHAARDRATREILVSFSHYRATVRLVFRGLVLTLGLLALKLLLVGARAAVALLSSPVILR